MSGPEHVGSEVPARIIGASLAFGGILTIAVGVYLGAAVEPLLYLVAGVGLVDLVLAWAFASGRIGPAARLRRRAQESGDTAGLAEADPSFNPYARED